MIKKLLPLFFLFLLCSCNNNLNANNNTVTQETKYQTIERNGTTAVLLKDSTLTNCYTALLDENGNRKWVDISQNWDLKKGNIVLILEESNHTAQVYIPTGDTPESLYGTLPYDSLSTKENDLRNGDFAIVNNQMTYQSISGEESEYLSGIVKIEKRQDGWCQVQPLAGGDSRTFWIPLKNLSFNMDAVIYDREEFS